MPNPTTESNLPTSAGHVKRALLWVGATIYSTMASRVLFVCLVAAAVRWFWVQSPLLGNAALPMGFTLALGAMAPAPRGRGPATWPSMRVFQWVECAFEYLVGDRPWSEKLSPFVSGLVGGLVHAPFFAAFTYLNEGIGHTEAFVAFTLLWTAVLGFHGVSSKGRTSAFRT